MEAFGERPFDISIDHFDACLFSIGDEVVAWLIFYAFLMF